METKKIKVSETTATLMQAMGRLQTSYFEIYEVLEGKKFETKELVEAWNTLNKALIRDIGLLVTETYGETDREEI